MRVLSSFYLPALSIILTMVLSACTGNLPSLKWSAPQNQYGQNWEATPTQPPSQSEPINGTIAPTTVSGASVKITSADSKSNETPTDEFRPVEYSYPQPLARLRPIKTQWGLVMGTCLDIATGSLWLRQVVSASVQWLAVPIEINQAEETGSKSACLTEVLTQASLSKVKIALQVTAPSVNISSRTSLADLSRASDGLSNIMQAHSAIQALQVQWPDQMPVESYLAALSSFYGAVKRVTPHVWVIPVMPGDLASTQSLDALRIMSQGKTFADCFGSSVVDMDAVRRVALLYPTRVICGVFRGNLFALKQLKQLNLPSMLLGFVKPEQPALPLSYSINDSQLVTLAAISPSRRGLI